MKFHTGELLPACSIPSKAAHIHLRRSTTLSLKSRLRADITLLSVELVPTTTDNTIGSDTAIPGFTLLIAPV
ncbi:MAG: hypothetical protein R2744_07205 [Bacteroidales bacterium]